MALLTTNNRWFAASIATLCTFSTMLLAIPSGQATSIASSHSTRLTAQSPTAQSKCSAAALSRSNPPFQCVTPKVFSCLKRNNASGGGSLEYRGDTSGEIVVRSNVVGSVALLGFNWNPSSETLNLNVKKKNFGVQEQQIWNGFKGTLSKCR